MFETLVEVTEHALVEPICQVERVASDVRKCGWGPGCSGLFDDYNDQ